MPEGRRVRRSTLRSLQPDATHVADVDGDVNRWGISGEVRFDLGRLAIARDAKSSTDAVAAARRYSGSVGGVDLCQVAVHLTSATTRGHRLIARRLHLTREWAADHERRELAGVPDELCFATEPQLTEDML